MSVKRRAPIPGDPSTERVYTLERAAELADWRYAYAGGRSLEHAEPEEARQFFDLTITLAERPAGQGDTEAMFTLGYLLRSTDRLKAISWYRSAAQAGHSGAMTHLAVELKDDQPVEAGVWEERAVEAGNANALYNRGTRIKSDPTKAAEYYRLAADRGSSSAMVQLGRISNEAHDHDSAIDWWRRAAEAGNAAAMLNLGIILRKKDKKVSIDWTERAAKLGNIQAMKNLAVLLEPTDWDTALYWTKRAADLGDLEASANLERSQRRRWYDGPILRILHRMADWLSKRES